MLSLIAADPGSGRPLLERPGAFLWWYLDLVGEDGSGLVLIWSFGLPFLPGLSAAARAGRLSAPRARPALTISLYERGKPCFYLLQELDEADAAWGEGEWSFAASRIVMQVEGEETRVDAELDCPIPGAAARLRGRVSARGPLRRGAGGDAGDHGWSPLLAAARGEAHLSWGAGRFALEGRAYLDRNYGARPLHTLGIRRWWWARLALPGRELVWYRLEPQERGGETRELALEVGADGETRAAEGGGALLAGWRPSLYGLWWPRQVALRTPGGGEAALRLERRVDDGPFYQRYLVRGRLGEEEGRGVAEQVAPGRLDPPFLAPFVRMRLHRVGGANSFWLPLFSGPAAGRLSRLLGRATPALLRGATP